MKFFKQLFLLFVSVFFLWSNVLGQVFSHAGGGSVSGWTYTNNISSQSIDQTSYWLVEAGNPSDVIITSSYDLCAFASATFSIDVATYGTGSNNPAKVEISYNGGGTYTDVFTTSTPTSSSPYVTSVFTLSQLSSQVVIKISNKGTSNRGVRLKNLVLTGTGTGSCSPSIPPILVNQSFSGTVGGAFSQTASNSGGSATSWAIISGTLPAGLSLNTTTGAITGTPTATGSSSVVIEATNANGSSSATYSFSITSGPCYINNGPSGTLGGSTYAGDPDSGGSPTSTIRLATGSNPGSISFTTSGISAGNVKLRFRAKGWSSSEIQVTATVDGQSVLYTTLSTSFDWVEITYSGVSANPSISFSTVANKRVHIGNIEVICLPPSCTPTITLTTVRPSSAPVDSKVQIEVNNSALISQVKLGTTSLSFTTLNATTIEVDIPTSMSAGAMDLHLIEASSCEVTTPFTVLSSTGTCSSLPATYNDLFISEVYDSDGLNQWYMELFNPTPNPIVLDGIYQIKRSGDVTPLVYDRTIDLIGTVAPYSVFTLRIGDIPGPFTCNGIAYDFTENGPGINEGDQIDLFKNGVQVDISRAPNEKGYILKRNIVTGQTVPTTSYNAVQWDINSTESCANLGSFPVTVTNINVVSPADVKGCKIDVSVSSSTPGVTYTWYYNNPKTMTNWLLVNNTNLPSYTITGNSTNHLVISGSTVSLNGYQFYCEISDGTCGKLSNTAEFTYENVRYYRSVTNGNWTTVANWESTNNLAGTWTSACDYPTAANSSKVFIENGTTIQLDVDNDIDYLEIKSGGTLEILPNSQLTIYDSTTNADLLVDGTLLYRSNSTNNLTFGPSATWKLGANATIIKTNNGGADDLRDRYEGGISTIPATAQWIYRYNSDGNPSTVSINMYYPNLRFENTTGTPFTANILSSLAGSTSSVIIKGNLEVGTTGTSTFTLYNNNNHVNPILVMGNFSIGNGSELTNVALASSVEGTGYELKGNLFIDGKLNLVAGITERLFKFSGTTNQTVSGAGAINIYKIETNKASGDVILNRNLQAQNELKMINGHIYTNANTLELGLNITQKGTLTYTSGFVIGRMKRWFNGTNSGDASSLFPMGFNDSGLKNRFARIQYTAAPTAGGDLTVFFVGADMTYNGLVIPAASSGGFGSDVKNAEDQGYWTCTAGTLAGGTYTSSFTGEGFTQIVSLADITLLKRPNSASPWTTPGVHIAATGSTVMPTVSRNNLSGFSDFGFGSRNNANPLPVELTNFTVSCEEEVVIRWITASERDNDKFVVEKTTDLQNWMEVQEVKGQGNSTHTTNYKITDKHDNEVVYYRLTQVDFNGKTTHFQPKSSLCREETFSVHVYPNPASNNLFIEANNSFIQALTVVDNVGKIVAQKTLPEKAINYSLTISHLANGIYTLLISTDKGTNIKKIEVMK